MLKQGFLHFDNILNDDIRELAPIRFSSSWINRTRARRAFTTT